MPALSILICTLIQRRQIRRALFSNLKSQCAGRDVEILYEEDAGKMTIGEKRQRLLERSRGKYVCFVDDDDAVAKDYVTLILAALRSCPEATHCSLRGVLLQPGRTRQSFEHSTKHRSWGALNGVYIRTPNHLNVIRRDLALRAGFTATNWGEDKAFSDRLAELDCLTCEAGIEPVLYYYRDFKNVRKSVVVPPAKRRRQLRPPYRRE